MAYCWSTLLDWRLMPLERLWLSIGVLDRRSDPGPNLAAFGISQDAASALLRLDSMLASGPGLTVVPDLQP